MLESQIADEFHKSLTLESEQHDEDQDSASSDFEFSFSGVAKSPVPAEDIFENGQIRPIFPFSGDNSEEASSSFGPPVRKLFVVSSPERDDVAEGPYCAWSSDKSNGKTPAPAPEMRRRSNSTGFSKLWKVRDLLSRSHSDGKDAFVFLRGKSEERMAMAPEKKEKTRITKVERKKEGETTASKEKKKGKQKSAYEVFYGKRDKKTGKGKSSYLPYRQDLMGFFTNVNGMSRNVHPY